MDYLDIPNCSLFCGDNVEVMRREIADNSIQLTVTSPPYDNLRKYNGFSWSFEDVALELYRVTRSGGVVVWVVADATLNRSETCTAFKQAMFFKSSGFFLYDTMIYRKLNYAPLTHRRYEQEWEYMFGFTKGNPSVFNPLKIPCKHAGSTTWDRPRYYKTSDSTLTQSKQKQPIGETKIHGNIFEYRVGAAGGTHGKHPAPFPERLAADQINTWSNPEDLVFDPFLGSGTTGKMALLNSRRFIGVDISQAYVDLSYGRIKRALEVTI